MSTKTRNLSNIDGANVGTPTEGGFITMNLVVYADDAAYETAILPNLPAIGDVYFNSTEMALREYNGTSWQYDRSGFSTQNDSTSTGADQDITPQAGSQIIRFTGGSLTSIRGIIPTLQKQLFLVNDQAANGIILRNQAGGATAANRIITGNGADLSIMTNQIVCLTYDTTATRWRVTSVSSLRPLDSFANDAAFSTAHSPPVAGDRYWNTTELVVRQYDGTNWFNNKVIFSTQNNSSLTGSAADLTPAFDQIIKLTNVSLTVLRSIVPSIQKLLFLINGTGGAVTVKNEDLTATAANRITTGIGADLRLENGKNIIVAYDTVASRWTIIGGTGTALGSPYYGNTPSIYTQSVSLNVAGVTGSPNSVVTVVEDASYIQSSPTISVPGGNATSAGTVSIPILRPGYYRVDVKASTATQGSTTQKGIRVVFGGTASKLGDTPGEDAENNAAASGRDLINARVIYYRVTAAGQTITINSQGTVTSGSPASLYCSIMITPV